MRKHLPDILAIIGALTLVSGVAMMHVPTACIVAGVLLIFTGYSLHRAHK